MKKVFSFAIAIVTSVLAPSYHISAQNGFSSGGPLLSLAQCRAIALDSSLTVENANLRYQKQEYDRKAMRTNFLPKFSGYAYYLWTANTFKYDFQGTKLPIYKNVNGNLVPDLMLDPAGKVVYNEGVPVFNQYAVIPPATLELFPANSWLSGVKVVQPIYMGGKIVAGYQMTRIGSEIASLNLQKSRADVVVSVDEAYWTYVRTLKLRDAAYSFTQAVDSVYKTVQDAVELGMATSNDLLKVKVQINNARLMCSKADNGSCLALMNLCHAMGIPLETPLSVVTDGFDVSSESFEDLAGDIENRPEYQMLDRNAELKGKAVKVARAEFLPQLGAMASFGYARGLVFKDSPLLNNRGFTVMATLKVPIFQWGEGVYKVRAAKKEYEMAVNEARQMQDLMKLDMTKNRMDLSDAQLQAQMAHTSVEDADLNLKTANDRYRTGMGTINDVLEAQTQRYKAESDYIEAVSACRLAYTNYLKSVGRL